METLRESAPAMEDKRANSPQSVTRVIQIIEALCASTAPLSLAGLSRALGMPKSSLAALLRGLSEAGLVTAEESAYRLGPAAFGLGSALLEARRRIQSSDLVRESIKRLAEKCGETVLFAVRDVDGETLTYVDVLESRSTVRFSGSVGQRRPLFCTAGGRALLAALPEAEWRDYLDGLSPVQLTAATEVDKNELAEIIFEVAKSGVAQTKDQTSEGAAGTAAVIRDATGAVIGALVAAAPSLRFERTHTELTRLVREEALVASRSLGYRPSISD